MNDQNFERREEAAATRLDETYIKRGRIYEFSLCPAMQGATE